MIAQELLYKSFAWNTFIQECWQHPFSLLNTILKYADNGPFISEILPTMLTMTFFSLLLGAAPLDVIVDDAQQRIQTVFGLGETVELKVKLRGKV